MQNAKSSGTNCQKSLQPKQRSMKVTKGGDNDKWWRYNVPGCQADALGKMGDGDKRSIPESQALVVTYDMEEEAATAYDQWTMNRGFGWDGVS